MNRRALLKTSVIAITPILAGCSSNSSTEQDTEKAQENLQEAGRALQNAGEEITSESAKFEESEFQGGGVDVKTTTIDGYLETATSELDEAEEYANEDQQELIEAARGYISFATKAVEFLDTFAEGYSQASTGLTYFQSERYEDAVDELETAESSLAESDDLLTVTLSRAEDLNTDILTDLESVEVQSLQPRLEDMDELIKVFRSMIEGMISVSNGMIDFTEADSYLESERYSDAERAFRSASDDFSAAQSTFQSEEETAPTEMKSTFVEMTCYSKSLNDASTHFADGMEAIQSGDQDQAESEVNAAEEDLNRCDFSSN